MERTHIALHDLQVSQPSSYIERPFADLDISADMGRGQEGHCGLVIR